MYLLNCLDKSELATRKTWLYFFIIYSGYGALTTVLNAPLFPTLPMKNYVLILVGANLIFALLLYYFAYEKFGTRLLSWVIIGGFMVGMEIPNQWLSPTPAIPFNSIWNFLAFVFLLIGMLYFNLQLRKINLKMQRILYQKRRTQSHISK